MAITQKIRTKTGFETVTMTPMKAIRRNCHECCGYNYAEVAKCEIELCCFYQYRLGFKPDQVGRHANNDNSVPET